MLLINCHNSNAGFGAITQPAAYIKASNTGDHDGFERPLPLMEILWS